MCRGTSNNASEWVATILDGVAPRRNSLLCRRFPVVQLLVGGRKFHMTAVDFAFLNDRIVEPPCL